jgi:hypothetical protein
VREVAVRQEVELQELVGVVVVDWGVEAVLRGACAAKGIGDGNDLDLEEHIELQLENEGFELEPTIGSNSSWN